MQLKRCSQTLLLLATAAVCSAQTPASSPATAPNSDLQIAKWSAHFEIQQAGTVIQPDAQGIYHLKPKPFAIHITGDIDHLGILASTTDAFAKALADAKHPIIMLGGSGGADTEGDLFLNDKARLAPLDELKPILQETFQEYEKPLLEKLKDRPLVVDSSFQPMDHYAPDGSHDFIFRIDHPFTAPDTLFALDKDGKPPATPEPKEIPWTAIQTMHLTLVLQNELLKDMLSEIHWRAASIQFDAK